MAELFDAIIKEGYFMPFGNMSPAQKECQEFTKKNIKDLTSARQREKYLKELRVCVCGYEPNDESEEMEQNNFSQYQFFKPYMDLVFHVDKFDFIILCVSCATCRVQAGFEHRYMCALMSALTFKQFTVPEQPEQVLDLRQPVTPRTIGEQGEIDPDRIVSFRERRRSFSNNLKEELQRLEAEQLEVERARGEHPSVMGWEETDRVAAKARDDAILASRRDDPPPPPAAPTGEAQKAPVEGVKPAEEPPAPDAAAGAPSAAPQP